jgi:hypothetical protein
MAAPQHTGNGLGSRGSSRSLPGARRQPGTGHALAQTALPEEILFQSPDLLVEQVTDHLDQAREVIQSMGTNRASSRVQDYGDWLPPGAFVVAARREGSRIPYRFRTREVASLSSAPAAITMRCRPWPGMNWSR